MKGRSIVDFEGFFANSPVFRESLLPDNNPDDDDESSDDGYKSYMRRKRRLRRTMTDGSLTGLGSPITATSLSEDELLTCPPLVPIFSLAVRQWCLAFIDDLGEIRWNPDTFDQLQVDIEIKEAIQGLVRGYSTHATVFDDFIAGKGRGLVFLLHGPPGCGKTMTAGESVPIPGYQC
ncbi:hypothetical protein IMZ48_04300 [Candidatus Bathyarchaeota archaeon]|nr:hypothetical protein [Candidatus Bathyarchaeota archaeon]